MVVGTEMQTAISCRSCHAHDYIKNHYKLVLIKSCQYM